MGRRVAESYRGLADLFAPAAHPRAPAGAAAGGQFVSASGSESGGEGASKDKQDQVKAIQKLLGLKETGKFTPADAAALRHYQAVHGLKVDGIAGAQTVAALTGQGKHGPGAMSAADRKKLLEVTRGTGGKADAKKKAAAAAAKPAAKPPPAAKADAKKTAAKPAAKPAPATTSKRADTHPGGGNVERLHEYWVHGEGAAKVRWPEPGAHTRCHRLLMEHADMTSEQAWGYCQLAGHAATGKYSGDKAASGDGHGRAQPVTTYTRSFALEDISVRSDGDGRTVDAYAAVFNTAAPVSDQDGQYEEVIDPAAFNRAIEHARRAKGGWSIPVMFNHGMTIFHTPSERHSVPIGIPLEIRADQRGLFTRTRYHNTPAADEVLEAIREGSISAYSFSGAFHRSDPMVPRGGFRRSAVGGLPTVRRTESTLREYGPATFPVYAGAEVVGVRAEQAAMMLGSLSAEERDRLISMFRSGTPQVSPEPGTSDDSEPAAEDPPAWHSDRPPKQIIQAARSAWIQRHGGAQ
jgi:HK97 family phage prohead protease